MKKIIFILIVSLVLIIIWQALVPVRENEMVLVVRFGRPHDISLAPGLHWKIPLIDHIIRYDGRIQSLKLPPLEIPTADNHLIELSCGAYWRVVDPKALYRSVRTPAAAAQRLGDWLESAVRDEYARYQLVEIVRPQKVVLSGRTWHNVQGLTTDAERRNWRSRALGSGEQIEAQVEKRLKSQLQKANLGIELLKQITIRITYKGSIE